MKKVEMREIVKGVMLVAALFSFPSISRAAVVHNVQKTVHNLGSTSTGPFSTPNTSEICVFCHTPHNAVAGKKFLWNRSDTFAANQFMLYTASPTLNFPKGVTISEVSRMCMSCHDGATAMNSMANGAPGGFPAGGEKIGEKWPVFDDWGPNIGEYDVGTTTGGTNLTNDHPISFLYSDSETPIDPTIKAADVPGISIGGLPLWEGKVECVTCHDPHIYYGYPAGSRNDTCDGIGDCNLVPFLRKSNASSALCFTCHDK